MDEKLISTGMQTLDTFIGGGLQNGIILDTYGAAGTGKSQLCIQICLSYLQSTKNTNSIMFEDNTGNFRPERLLEMLGEQTRQKQHTKNDFAEDVSQPKDMLDRIIVSRTTNSHEQIDLVDKMIMEGDNTLPRQEQSCENVGLLVIDNITDHFSFEYSKESKFLSKHLQFMRYMRNLSYFALTTQIPVVITNTTRTDPTTNLEQETMYRSVSLFAHQKIHLSKITTTKDSSVLFSASVIPSYHYKKQVMYTITKKGLAEKLPYSSKSRP